MHITTSILYASYLAGVAHGLRNLARDAPSTCQPLNITFGGSTSHSDAFYKHFAPISSDGSYSLTDSGLELYLHKPPGIVTTAKGENDKLGYGATINSTFSIFNGKVTFLVEAPTISGVIVAGILIGDSGSSDEIDVELICGDAYTWQTNLFVADPRDSKPEYGVFSSKEAVDDINDVHAYSIEMTPDAVHWSLDGHALRTLKRDQCTRNGFLHYPTHSMRLQLGIWDASSPASTADWGKGPIDWQRAPEQIVAIFKGVRVECP